MLSIIIIFILGYIAYQLYSLNQAKKREEARLDEQKEDEQIRAFMPHLYKVGISDEQKATLKSFYYANSHYWERTVHNPYFTSDDIDGYSPAEKNIKLMEFAIKKEEDAVKKEKMEKAFERVGSNCKKIIGEIDKNKESTQFERHFVIWHYTKDEYEHFPDREGAFDDIAISDLVGLFPKKHK